MTNTDELLAILREHLVKRWRKLVISSWKTEGNKISIGYVLSPKNGIISLYKTTKNTSFFSPFARSDILKPSSRTKGQRTLLWTILENSRATSISMLHDLFSLLRDTTIFEGLNRLELPKARAKTKDFHTATFKPEAIELRTTTYGTDDKDRTKIPD